MTAHNFIVFKTEIFVTNFTKIFTFRIYFVSIHNRSIVRIYVLFLGRSLSMKPPAAAITFCRSCLDKVKIGDRFFI